MPLAVFFFITIAQIRDYHMDTRIREAVTETIHIADMVAGFGFDALAGGPGLGLLQFDINQISQNIGFRILVFDDGLRVIADSNFPAASRVGQITVVPEVMSTLATGQHVTHLRQPEAALYTALAVTSPFDSTPRAGAVLLVASVEDIFASLDEIRGTMMLISALVAMAVVLLTFVMANFLIGPLRRILRVVQRLGAGQLNQRVAHLHGSDEYVILARSFNAMAEKLEAVEKTREEFVSNVSHELKTPLSSMKVLSESILLQEHAPEEVYREFLQDIVTEVDRMTHINNDLLALVRIDQREQGLNIGPMSVNKLVEDILKRLSPLSDQRDIVLMYEDVRPIQIDADEIKLSLAISNIVENAIKYTPPGGTVIVIVDADHQFAYITVKDTGIGIAETEQDKIFNRFYRVDKTRDRETGGTGLGLAISHSTVLLHNGHIRVSSTPDEGSTFVIRIPIRRS